VPGEGHREAAAAPVRGRRRARLSRLLAAAAPAAAAGRRRVTSQELAHNTGIVASQVRRDLRRVGVPGKRGVGYSVRPLMLQLKAWLGAPAGRLALVGTDGLASDLLESGALAELGVEVACVFEERASANGNGARPQLGHALLPFDSIEREVSERGIEAAVIATEPARAQDAYERLCSAGVRLVVSFADRLFDPRPGVAVHIMAPPVPPPQTLSAIRAGSRARSSASRAASPVTNSRK
jgi:NADH/NAD ratio-sensing transcriptional regulator Rex